MPRPLAGVPLRSAPKLGQHKLEIYVGELGLSLHQLRRWVDDGDVITSSGVSAGIDMALSLIARIYGREMALTSARNMEYIWNEDATNDPFA